MSRVIVNTWPSKEVTYLGKRMIVDDVYPCIAYLRDPETDSVECVNLGDLVIAGLEPTSVSLAGLLL